MTETRQNYPTYHAQVTPDKVAVINATTGDQMTYKQLDDRSNQIVHLLRAHGIERGDVISVFADNKIDIFPLAWAAFRYGFYITMINRYLTVEEAVYIAEDNDCKILFASASLDVSKEMPDELKSSSCKHFFSIDGMLPGYQSLDLALSDLPSEAPEAETAGDAMLYSSGSTGKPKGVKRPLSGQHITESMLILGAMQAFGFNENTVYLSPAPLYHSAPFFYTNGTLALGGTVVFLEKFDSEIALQCIEQYRITYSQWVPTMFVRMLKLPEEVRAKYDVSSLQLAIHAAAPCPVEVKQQMIDWWGEILFEYYAGTEGNGMTAITAGEWLQNRGSVGKPINCVLHICDESGQELPVGETGTVYMEQPEVTFQYHKAKEKTSDSRHPEHANWSTLGDVGYVNAEGYLFLTDRKAYMIISGGVNIYPQEIEDVLIMHEKVADVAVFGVPNPDFGEEVKAVVQLEPGIEADDAQVVELLGYAREHLAGYKVPRSIDFNDALPRLPTGKLYKRILRDAYWGNKNTKIV